MTVSEFKQRIVGLRDDQVLLNLIPQNCQLLDAGVGSCYVLIKSIVPFGDGQRITLNVGNPSEYTYSGLRMRLEYGPERPASYEGMEAWNDRVRTKEVLMARELKPGYWKEVEVALSPGEGDRLEHVALSVDAAELSFAKGN
jgi:hypothetical protein